MRLPGMSFENDWTGILIANVKSMTESDGLFYTEIWPRRDRYFMGESTGYSSWLGVTYATSPQLWAAQDNVRWRIGRSVTVCAVD